MITTTTYRYIEVDVTDEDYFNDLVNDLNIQMQNNSNFDIFLSSFLSLRQNFEL